MTETWAPQNIPNIYGEGAIFAFSGVDGATHAASGFVATLLPRPGLLIHTPVRRVLRFDGMGLSEPLIVTGDVLVLRDPPGFGGRELVVTFTAWHTIRARRPFDVEPELTLEDGTLTTIRDGLWLSMTEQDCLAFARRGDEFAVCYGKTPDQAASRALRAFEVPWQKVVAERLAFVKKTPALADAGRSRLLQKCVSVMKVNTLSQEGPIRHRWSTPDRVPHRDMWLWDSVFHSLAMNHLDPRLSSEFLLSVLHVAKADGMVPHQTSPTGWQSGITQPPVLAWGIWENYQQFGDKAVLAEALPILERYIEWDCAQRDGNHNGLLEWFIEDSPACRSGESGLDNSQRFDKAVLMDAVDFSVFVAEDMRHIAQIAETLGDATKAAAWRARAGRVRRAVHELLWNEQICMYVDRHMDGRLSGVRAVTGFLPLLLEDLPKDRVTRLVAALSDPTHFACPCPVPSIALSDPKWSTDMWRGSTWLNMNYLIILGLRRHGRHAEAAALRDRTLGMTQKYYEQFGVTFEFFDPRDQLPPTKLDRKGPQQEPYDLRRKYDAIRDYHWTAAVAACLLCEEAGRA